MVKKQKRLAELYAEARQLSVAKKWQAVAKVFAQIKSIDPDYSDTENLLPIAEKKLEELKRQAEQNELYSRAVHEMDAGHWGEAQRLLGQVRAKEQGFLETERLLSKVETEIRQSEEEQNRQDQINTLYEQAHGLLRSKKWRQALEKIEAIRKLDEQFDDPEKIAERAQKELAREEQEAERQNELAAMYAEAMKLLKEEKYQEALDKWQEVKKIDPKYPDRQWVQRSARKGLARKIQPEKKIQIKLLTTRRKLIPIAGLSGLILLGFIGIFIVTHQPPVLPPCTFVTSINDPLLMKSRLSLSTVFVDGKTTYPTEWANAQCYQLSLVKWVPGQGCTGNQGVSSTWYVKNDRQQLYLLIKVPKADFSPEGVSVGYFYPYPYTGLWQNSDTMGIGDGRPLDQYGWDETNWHDDISDGGRMDTRANSTQTDQYDWYELSKPLDSGDSHDWSWKAGEKVGSDITGGLMIGSWGTLPAGAGDAYLCRYIQFQLGE